MDVIYLLEEYKDVINIKDLCEILNIGKNTAYKLLKNNDIPNRRLGKKYIIPKFGVIAVSYTHLTLPTTPYV